MKPPDEVRVLDQAGVPVAALEGEIDIANASGVREKIFATVSNSAPGLVLDLSKVTFLDSRGVQLILELADRLEMRHLLFRVVIPETSLIRGVLQLTHIDEIVPLDHTVEEAVAQIRAKS
jgi:anti-anti-sigma factor